MTESEPKKPDNSERLEQTNTPLGQFRQKITGLKEEEKMIGKTAHFDSINPEMLDEKDMQAYEDILNFDPKVGEIVELFKIVSTRRDELAPLVTDKTEKTESQKIFLAYLSNLAQGRIDKDFIR